MEIQAKQAAVLPLWGDMGISYIAKWYFSHLYDKVLNYAVLWIETKYNMQVTFDGVTAIYDFAWL